MGKTARAVHWTGHRHSARVPCPGAAGCVTLRFVRGFSSAVYAAGKDDPTVSAGGGNQEGATPSFWSVPRAAAGRGPRSAACFCRGHQESGLPRSGFGGGQQGKDRADQTSLWHLHECHTGTRTLPPIIGQNCQPVKHGVWDSSPAGACMETRRGTTFALGSVRKESAAAEPGTKGEKSPRALRLGDFSCDD